MAEPWSVEAEARRLCKCKGCKPEPEEAYWGDNCRAHFIAEGIRAGLTRAAAICGERATALLASRMSDYKQGAFDEAEACEAAIKNEAK